MAAFRSTHAVNQALLEHVEALVAQELPVREGPYALVPCKIPEAEREAREGLEGPVVHGEGLVFVYLQFDGLDRQGRPWSIEQAVRVCAADEWDLARVTAIVQAFARVARRAMRDAGDARFGERPWLGLINFAGAMYTLERAPKKRTRTVEECEAVLSVSRDLRDVLAPPAAALDAAIQALDGWLAAHRTLAKKPQVELVHVPKPSWSITSLVRGDGSGSGRRSRRRPAPSRNRRRRRAPHISLLRCATDARSCPSRQTRIASRAGGHSSGKRPAHQISRG